MLKLFAKLARRGPAPPREHGLWAMFLAVFFFFSVFGWLSVLVSPSHTETIFSSLVTASLSGGLAVMYAIAISLRWWWMLPIAIFSHLSAAPWLWDYLSRLDIVGNLPSEADHRPVRTLQMLLGVCSVVVGQTLLVWFINTNARRSQRIKSEVEQAQRIHEAVVTPIHLRLAGLEVVARTFPSAQIGGDLIDVIESVGCVDVLIADVAGHGVGAGLLSGMVKSAVRMQVGTASGADPATLAAMVERLNRMLVDLTRPDMFVTFACVRLLPVPAGDLRSIECVLAGHPPVLVWRRNSGEIDEVVNDALPLGIDRTTVSVATRLHVQSGDIVMLFTDGLDETTARSGSQRGRQLGIQGLKSIFASQARAAEKMQASLPAMHDAILLDVNTYGPQTDDRSLVLMQIV